MGDVINLDVPTFADVPVENVLDAAKDAGLTHVLVLGYGPDGALYGACSTGDAAETIYLLEQARFKLLSREW